MNGFGWLFIGISIVAVLLISWSLSSRGETSIEDAPVARRNLFLLFILLVLTPTLGIVIGLLTMGSPEAP